MAIEIACHTDDFGTSGQISPDDIVDIAARGYKSVINNRPDGEGGPEQPLNATIEDEAIKQGLVYCYLPVVCGQLTQEQVMQMADLLVNLPKPILAFCRSGARSTNLYLLAQQMG